VRAQAQKLNMPALPLVFNARGKAMLVAETTRLGDFITAAIHPGFHAKFHSAIICFNTMLTLALLSGLSCFLAF